MEEYEVIDAAQGLYWFCADNHGGQNSIMYQVLSEIPYTPARAERGPNTPDSIAFYSKLEELRKIATRHTTAHTTAYFEKAVWEIWEQVNSGLLAEEKD